MTTIVGAFNAKTHFSDLLKEVELGGQVVITRHGRPIAKLIPVHSVSNADKKVAIQKLIDFSKSHVLGDFDWKTLRDEGRK